MLLRLLLRQLLDSHVSIGVLDRTADVVKAYRLVSPNYVMYPYLKLVGRNLYISMGNVNDPEANPVLYVLSIDEVIPAAGTN